MKITKTPHGTFRVRHTYPTDVAKLLNLKHKNFDKIYKTREEAEKAEKDLIERIEKVKETNDPSMIIDNGELTIEMFYQQKWLEAYKTGYFSTIHSPSQVTIRNTEDIFRLHILPMFGKYTINYLNQNKSLVMDKMTNKAKEYVNFKIIRSYVNQLFDLAADYEYIKTNNLSNSLKRIKSNKKQVLSELQKEEDKYLTENELKKWIHAVNADYNNGFLTEQDYTMFWTTLLINCRKSETYALQWKYIDLKNSELDLVQALDKYGNIKSTKGNKNTIFSIPKPLEPILISWKETQRKELNQFNIKQTPNSFLFTSDNPIVTNQPVHTDYLNYRMKSIRKRHPELQIASPHKLRHTVATLANVNGMSVEEISKGLTHSDIKTTKIYINNVRTVSTTPGEFVYNKIKLDT